MDASVYNAESAIVVAIIHLKIIQTRQHIRNSFMDKLRAFVRPFLYKALKQFGNFWVFWIRQLLILTENKLVVIEFSLQLALELGR